jgi:hypothetical protein
LLGANVVGLPGAACSSHAEQPNAQIRSVEVAAHRSSVARHADVLAGNCIAHEIASSERAIERQARPQQSKNTGNADLQVTGRSPGHIGTDKRLRSTLGIAIGGSRLQGIRCANISFRNPRHRDRLCAVHGATRQLQKTSSTAGMTKIQHPPSTLQHGVENCQWTTQHGWVSDIGCGMNTEVKGSNRCGKPSDVPCHKHGVCPIECARSLRARAICVPCQHDQLDTAIKLVIGMLHSLQQPTSDETRATCHEQACATKLGPKIYGSRQNHIQIV